MPRAPETAEEFRWVDDGLAALGFALDLGADEVPERLRDGTAPSVAGLMPAVLALLDGDPAWIGEGPRAASPDGAWDAVVARLPGSPAVLERTILRNPPALDRERFVKFAIDDAMLDVARAWDETFVEGRFTHVLTRDGRRGAVGEVSVAGVPFADVAKVMRWVFAVPGLSRRELVSVYVPHADARSATCCYFPVVGPPVGPPPRGLVRARLMVPCLDRAVFDGARCAEFVHVASAELGGWVPAALTTSTPYLRAFLKAARVEAGHLERLFGGAGEEGAAFARIPRRDGTTVV